MPSASAAPADSALSDPLPIPSRFEPSPPLEPAASGVTVATHDRWLTVSGRWYSLNLPAHEAYLNRSPYAVLLGDDGNNWTDISLLASVHRAGSPDETYGLGAVQVRDRTDDEVTLAIPAASTAWEHREVRRHGTTETIEVSVAIRGVGDLEDVVLFGGTGTLRSGAGGEFRSSIGFRSIFVPVPTEPVAFVRPARAAATLGVVGDADPGRLHGIFSPPPLVLGLGRRDAAGATEVPGGSWLGLSVRGPVADLTFTTLRYEPMDSGFSLRLA
jgi:hypothetical protein